MRRFGFAVTAAVSLAVALFGTVVSEAATSQSNPCAVPNEIGDSIEETAWEIWVAATCPVNDNQYPFVVWENWIEQSQLYPTDPSKGLKVPNSGASTTTHPLHDSPLALALNPSLKLTSLPGAPDTNCNPAGAPPPDQPKLIICEEVRENGTTEDYIAGTNLWNRFGQQQAAANRDNIQFPRPAVEIKADWIELSSIGYTCSNLPPGFTNTVHVENINGECFALAGMHLISKLLDKWIWATFEPQNSITNPFRCKVLGCYDPFGSKPASSNGANTQLTRKLQALMDAANLAPEWQNYRLDAVQTDFFTPKLLGNSIIEGENVGMNLKQASCISCHAVSSVQSDGTDGINLLAAMSTPPVGFPPPLPAKDWIRRDFVWSLGLACPNGPGKIGSLQNCAQ
jgi:hypothetical protein